MNQLFVATRPYKKKTLMVIQSLKDFGLKKPNLVNVELTLDEVEKHGTLKVNDKLYISGKYGQIKNHSSEGFIYNNIAHLTDIVCHGLGEAGFPVKLKKITIKG